MMLEIDEHKSTDKKFDVVLDGVTFTVDYDDVDQSRVDAVVNTLATIVNNIWDEDTIKLEWAKELSKRWNSNEYIRHDYPTFESFLEDVGCVFR